jgi:hypothetical protein
VLFDCAFLVDVGRTIVLFLGRHGAGQRVHLPSDEEHRYNKNENCKVEPRRVDELAEKNLADCKCGW